MGLAVAVRSRRSTEVGAGVGADRNVERARGAGASRGEEAHPWNEIGPLYKRLPFHQAKNPRSPLYDAFLALTTAFLDGAKASNSNSAPHLG